MDELAERWLGHKPHRLQGGRRHGQEPDRPSTRCRSTSATAYAAEDADVTLRLWHGAEAAPGRRAHDHASTRRWSGRWSPVLARMEARGISIDRQILSRLSGEFAQRRRAARSRDLRARRRAASTSARPSSSATSCSARWACPAARRPRPAQWSTGAERARGPRRRGPRAAAQASSTGASSPS